MPRIRLSILVTDGERFLVNLDRGNDLPGMEIPEDDEREDEAILEENGRSLTRLPIGGYAFLESVIVRRGGGRIENLYLAAKFEGDALPEQPPAGFAWVSVEDLDRSAIPAEVLDTLEMIFKGGKALAGDSLAALGAWQADG